VRDLNIDKKTIKILSNMQMKD